MCQLCNPNSHNRDLPLNAVFESCHFCDLFDIFQISVLESQQIGKKKKSTKIDLSLVLIRKLHFAENPKRKYNLPVSEGKGI